MPKQSRWLSVQQLVFYQTVLQVHKVLLSGKPDHLSNKFSTNHPYRTRQATGGGVRVGEEFDARSGLSHGSFCYRGTLDYNKIPAYIRKAGTLGTFKYKLKQWVSLLTSYLYIYSFLSLSVSVHLLSPAGRKVLYT